MNIHIVSNSPNMLSGFGNVSRYIALGLKELGHDVTMTGLQSAYLPQYMFGIEVLPIDVQYVDETTRLMLNIQNTRADVVLAIFQSDADMNHLLKIAMKTVLYTPIEGLRVPTFSLNDYVQVIQNHGKIVAQCNFGKNEIERSAKLVGLNSIIKDIPVIYHGVNENIFRKLDDKELDEKYCFYCTEIGKLLSDPKMLHDQGCFDCKLDIKKQCNCTNFKEEIVSILKWENGRIMEKDIPITKLKDVFKGKFVYSFIGQNFGVRKRIEILLKAYSAMINDSKLMKDRTCLHLHTVPLALNGINLVEIISELGINDNVSFSYGSFRSNAWSEEALSRLLNLSDVNVSASSGEGFNLPMIESMSCGIPNIGPDFSSFTELIGKVDEKPRGILAELSDIQLTQTGSWRALVSVKDLASKMKTMYIKEEDRKEYSKNALEFSSKYTWEKVVKQWDELLKIIK